MIKLTHFRHLLQQNWYQMYWVSFPLEHTSNVKRGVLVHGQPRFSISSAQACTLDRILLQVDIIALQETRLPEFGIIRERDYSFFWQSKAADETREHGVSFAIKNNLLGSIIPPSEGTERLLKLQL